ncbi:hypothetical protein [Tabrizicola sp. BL-A-41-H6]
MIAPATDRFGNAIEPVVPLVIGATGRRDRWHVPALMNEVARFVIGR